MRLIAALAASLIFVCGYAQTESSESSSLALQSSAFEDQGTIPLHYSCAGNNAVPPLFISGVPKAAKSLALVMEDPDAPGRVFVHWVVWNIDPQTKQITQQQGLGTKGQNSYGSMDYRGPCPPPGETHRYIFTLYALDIQLTLPAGSIRQQLDRAMEGHILQSAQYTGTFGK